jgi:hypothetical protein
VFQDRDQLFLIDPIQEETSAPPLHLAKEIDSVSEELRLKNSGQREISKIIFMFRVTRHWQKHLELP